MGRRAAVATLSAAALALGMLSAPILSSLAAAPVGPPGRLGFTDAQDQVNRISLRGDVSTMAVAGEATRVQTVQTAGRHDAQASATISWSPTVNLGYSFVSTRATSAGSDADDPDGEVWLVPPGDGATEPAPLQLTDDDAHETHPVAWLDESCSIYGGGHIDVVYASDRSGTWDLWVVHLRPSGDDSGGCGDYQVSDPEQLTSGPGDDLWPNWVADTSGESRSVVFSSTRSDPLGDLYELRYNQGQDLPLPGSALTQLTSGRAADSTPAPRNYDAVPVVCPGDPSERSPRWLAFTRADSDDPRGGLAVLDLDDPGGGALSLGTPAASQPAWSPDGTRLAYRSTAEDPDGAIRNDLFRRICPPDLAVSELTVSPTSVSVGGEVSISVTVVNNSPQRAAGRLTLDFSALLEPPEECDSQRRCVMDVPMLGQGEARTFSWPMGSEPGPQAVATGTQNVTAAVQVTETEGDQTPRPDGVPANNSRAVALTVTRAVDIAIPSNDGGGLGLGVVVTPATLIFPDGVATQAGTVTVRVDNPDSDPVGATVTVASGNLLLTFTGAQPPRRTLTIPGHDVASTQFAFVAARPPAGQATVAVSASADVVAPAVDPDRTNNTGSASVSLLLDGGTDVTPAAAARAAAVTEVSRARPAGTTVAAHLAAAVVRAAVPAAVKPPVADRVTLLAGPLVADRFGVSESTPSFSLLLIDDGSPYFQETNTLLVTVRPASSQVSDVLSSDGSDRRVVAAPDDQDNAAPSYSPDGRFVAYQRAVCDLPAGPAMAGCQIPGKEIVVAPVDGIGPAPIYPGSQRRPTGASDVNPAWSPDGTAIAFTRLRSDRDESSAIWLAEGFDLDRDTVPAASLVATSVRQLTHPTYALEFGDIDEFDDEAAWSPDGSRIAYTRARFDTQALRRPSDEEDRLPSDRRPTQAAHDSDIWVVDVATGDTDPLLPVEVGGGEGDSVCREAAGRVCAGGDDRGADWSPDGSRIVYEHTGWLYLADPAERGDLGPVTGPRSIAAGTSGPRYPDDPPASAAATGQAARFFAALDWAQDPAWSPDGRQIAFTGHPRGQPDLRGIDALTVPDRPADRSVRTVTDQPQPELQPDWQPLADLAITLTAAPPAAPPGTPTGLTATITNEGIGTALHASMTLTLPVGLTLGTLPSGCSPGPPITCTLGDLLAGTHQVRTIPVTSSVPGSIVASAVTASRTVDPDPADNKTTMRFGAPGGIPVSRADVSVSLAVAPNPGYVGGPQKVTVTVRNGGPNSTEVTLRVAVPNGSGPPSGQACLAPTGCPLGVMLVGAQVVREVTLTPTKALRGDVTAEVSGAVVDTLPANNAARMRIRVLQPVLTLSPPLGAPGFVTAALGEDFPPGGRVVLRWDPGLNASSEPIRVSSDGTFRTPVVVLVRDQLGIRTITATRQAGLEFGPVEAEFLVVPRTQQPPDFQGRG